MITQTKAPVTVIRRMASVARDYDRAASRHAAARFHGKAGTARMQAHAIREAIRYALGVPMDGGE